MAGMPNKVPFRKLNRPKPDVTVTKIKDGSYRIKSNISIGDYKKNAGSFLRDAALELPDRAFLVQCGPQEDWPELTYSQAKNKADQISCWLLQNNYSSETPILILSGNSFAHALLSMGAIQVGIPIVPVSPSYSLMTGDYAKLKYAAELVGAKMIFAEDQTIFGSAIDSILQNNMDVVTVNNTKGGNLSFDTLLGKVDEARVADAFDKVEGDTLAKVLFTSGSTGMPKAVPNTHLMICASQKMHEMITEPRDPINDPSEVLDWLPWHHTYGGNVNFFGIMRVAGTMFMDDGKPVPSLVQRTFSNIKRVKPTRFSSVPAAYSFLLDQMENDSELSESFFSRVKICQYGGAALSQELFERMQVLAIQYTGMRMPFGTGWGSTETTGTGTAVFWDTEKVGLIGVPYAGIEVKLVPVADKFEIRIRGPHVHTGYYKRPDLTAEYFDEDGYYCMGDAVSFENPDNLEQGLTFSGRVSEDFKLANGSWVATGELRLTLIDALDPIARDIVIAGHNKNDIAIMILPSEEALRGAGVTLSATSSADTVIQSETMISAFREKLEAYNAKNKSNSRFVAHAAIMAAPLSVDNNEITDKQYINQSAVLNNRASLVEKLYASISAPEIMNFNKK